jgi:hypothetical protein
MTPERFHACLDAYGADLARWPADEIAAARAFAAEATPELRERMAQAALLDAWLVDDVVAPPDDALVRRILDSAPAARAPAARTPAAPRTPWWRDWLWPAGMAGAGLAGSLAGVLVVSVVLQHAPPSPAPDLNAHGTAFTTGAGDWSEE